MESVTTEDNIKQWVAEYEAINGVTVKIKARKKLSNENALRYSPFPRYFKRKGGRETLAPERGYGKYTSNMADDEWLCMPVKTSYGGSLKLVV